MGDSQIHEVEAARSPARLDRVECLPGRGLQSGSTAAASRGLYWGSLVARCLRSQPTDARWFTPVTSSAANPNFAEYQRRTTRVSPVVVLERLGWGSISELSTQSKRRDRS